MSDKELIIMDQEETSLTIPEIKAELPNVVSEAEAYQITSQTMFEKVCDFVKKIKLFIKAVDDQCDTGIKKAHETHKQLISDKKKLSDPFAKALKIATDKVNDYNREQERIRQAEQRRLQEEARRKAEEEAERKRKENEFLADISGETAPEPEPVIVPEIKVEAPAKVDGTYFADEWNYKVVSFAALPDEYKIPDDKKLGGVVRALKGTTNIQGVEVWVEKKIRVRPS